LLESGPVQEAEAMSERVADLGGGLELWRFNVDETIEQDLNARAQPKEMFERLTATIGKDGRLEALPFLAQTQRGLEIVSGHHRVRAARAADVTDIYGVVDVTNLTRDQIAAKQLAHNAISGYDDTQIISTRHPRSSSGRSRAPGPVRHGWPTLRSGRTSARRRCGS
jgi:hypothetical protein